MPRHSRWSDLRVGLVAIAVISALVVGILFFGRLGRIPGETYRVFVRTEDARGIIRGSEVWLAGQKVGAVRRIEFLPPAGGAEARVLLEVELTARHRQALRRDSGVEIRAGGNLIGAPVVYLSIGTPEAAVVEAGDTLVASPANDIESVTDRAAKAMDELPLIMEDVRALATVVRSPDGTVGAFLHERGTGDVGGTRRSMSALAARVRNERGTLGLALGGRGQLVNRARLAMSRADSVRQLIGSTQSSLGRFRRDSTLAAEIGDIRNELTIVRALMSDPTGNVGRFRQDSAIVAGLAEVEREMGILFEDVKRRPFRYLSF